MLEIPSFTVIEGLTISTAQNITIAQRIPKAVGRAMKDSNAKVKRYNTPERVVTVPYYDDPTVRLETGVWDLRTDDQRNSVTAIRLGVHDQDGGAEFEVHTYQIAELNLSTDAILLYILSFYAAQYNLN